MHLGPGLSDSFSWLSVLSHALGWQSKPTLWMTSQPRNPLELRRGKLDSGKTQATIRLMRVWASSHGHWGPGPGDGNSKHGNGDSKHALSTSWVPACNLVLLTATPWACLSSALFYSRENWGAWMQYQGSKSVRQRFAFVFKIQENDWNNFISLH